MQNRLIVTLVILFACSNAKSKNVFTVEGKVTNTTAQLIYLEENIPNKALVIIDSAIVTNGRFVVKTTDGGESLYQLRLAGSLYPLAVFINDRPLVTITADTSNNVRSYDVHGSPASQTILDFDQRSVAIGSRIDLFSRSVDSLRGAATADSLFKDSYTKLITEAKALRSLADEFLANANTPITTLYIISSFQNLTKNLQMQGFTDVEEAAFIRAAAKKYPNHIALKEITQSKSVITP